MNSADRNEDENASDDAEEESIFWMKEDGLYTAGLWNSNNKEAAKKNTKSVRRKGANGHNTKSRLTPSGISNVLPFTTPSVKSFSLESTRGSEVVVNTRISNSSADYRRRHRKSFPTFPTLSLLAQNKYRNHLLVRPLYCSWLS